MQDATTEAPVLAEQMAPSGFCAFKVRPGSDVKDGFVYGLLLVDLQDDRRFPQGKQYDEKGEFVWGCDLEGKKV